jgi:O-antigen/teichoic acid export membrane protein
LLQILAFGAVPTILSQPLAMAMQARRHDKLVSKVVGLGIAFQLTFVAILSKRYDAIGAAYAFLMGQIIIFTLLFTFMFYYALSEKNDS